MLSATLPQSSRLWLTFAPRPASAQAAKCGAVMREPLIHGRFGAVRRPVQRPLLDGQQTGKRNAKADRGSDKNPVERRTEIAVPASELVERHRRPLGNA